MPTGPAAAAAPDAPAAAPPADFAVALFAAAPDPAELVARLSSAVAPSGPVFDVPEPCPGEPTRDRECMVLTMAPVGAARSSTPDSAPAGPRWR